MKPARKSGFDRFMIRPFKQSGERKGAGQPGDRADERKEGLVLLAIAILFVANVVIYLCHHYGLTSLNDWRTHPVASLRMMVD